jgi:uncharacterized protein YdiU (UPF0061 family)
MDIKESWKSYKNITNKLIEAKKIPQMKKVYNKLNLIEGSNEDAIVAAIDKLDVENKAGNKKIQDLENELANKKADYDKLANELNEMKAKAKADEEARVGNKSKEIISNAVKIGKIKNDAKVIEMWENNYKTNPTGTEEMLESMGITKKSADISQDKIANEGELTNVVAKEMATLRNKFNL